MNEATRRRLEARSAQKKARPSKPKAKAPRPTDGGSAQASTPAERRREKRVAEAELVREAHLQVTGKRRPRGPNEDVAVLVPDDEEEAEAGPVNIACPRKVVPFVNAFIDGAQMELPELEQLPMKSVREQAGRAFRAKKRAVEEYRSSEEFTAFLDKEVMVQCEDLIYRFKRFNADKKLNLNFLRDPPPLPEGVTEERVEAYLGEDAEVDSSSGSESGSEDEEETPPPEPSSVPDAE
ncbi:unnamed protein product, partial [Prunus brigantina]